MNPQACVAQSEAHTHTHTHTHRLWCCSGSCMRAATWRHIMRTHVQCCVLSLTSALELDDCHTHGCVHIEELLYTHTHTCAKVKAASLHGVSAASAALYCVPCADLTVLTSACVCSKIQMLPGSTSYRTVLRVNTGPRGKGKPVRNWGLNCGRRKRGQRHAASECLRDATVSLCWLTRLLLWRLYTVCVTPGNQPPGRTAAGDTVGVRSPAALQRVQGSACLRPLDGDVALSIHLNTARASSMPSLPGWAAMSVLEAGSHSEHALPSFWSRSRSFRPQFCSLQSCAQGFCLLSWSA